MSVCQRAQGPRRVQANRVLIYMPMTIEGVIAMQACAARIGATHSVAFAGFSAGSCA